MKKLFYVIVAALCLVACEKNTESGSTTTTKGDYVDLGLSSGTKWKSANEMNPNDDNGFYDYYEAMSLLFEKNLPTKEQWMELVNECKWEWTGRGYRVTGVNNNSIVLPAAGYRHCSGYVGGIGTDGGYWSSTPNGSGYAWVLHFLSSGVYPDYDYRCNGQSVRLVC